MTDYRDDIPLSVAVGAYSGMSFTPERSGARSRDEYSDTLTADLALFTEQGIKGQTSGMVAEEFERYRAGLRSRYLKMLHSRGRTISPMITGPSNFPVRQNGKRLEVERRRVEEYLDFRNRARAAICSKLRPDLQPIRSGDDDAAEALQQKIAEAENLQAKMKAANATIRKHKKAGPEAQIAALAAGHGFTRGQAIKLLEPDCCGRIGFADFELTNNGANIRRMQQRLENVKRAKAKPVSEAEGAAARLEDDPPANRVRLFFPGKPSEEVRSTLKRSGFRWSPTLGAWQAYRNWSSIALAKKVAGIPEAQAAE